MMRPDSAVPPDGAGREPRRRHALPVQVTAATAVDAARRSDVPPDGRRPTCRGALLPRPAGLRRAVPPAWPARCAARSPRRPPDAFDEAALIAFVYRTAAAAVDAARRRATAGLPAQLAQLPPAQREVLVLRVAVGLSVERAAAALGATPDAGAPRAAPGPAAPAHALSPVDQRPPPAPACRAPRRRSPPTSRRAVARCGACAGSGPSARPAASRPARGTRPRRGAARRRPPPAPRARARPRCRAAARGASSRGRTSSRSSRCRPGRRRGARPPSRGRRRARRRLTIQLLA